MFNCVYEKTILQNNKIKQINKYNFSAYLKFGVFNSIRHFVYFKYYKTGVYINLFFFKYNKLLQYLII